MTDNIRNRIALLCIQLAKKLTTWGLVYDILFEAEDDQRRHMEAND